MKLYVATWRDKEQGKEIRRAVCYTEDDVNLFTGRLDVLEQAGYWYNQHILTVDEPPCKQTVKELIVSYGGTVS